MNLPLKGLGILRSDYPAYNLVADKNIGGEFGGSLHDIERIRALKKFTIRIDSTPINKGDYYIRLIQSLTLLIN